MKPETKVRLLNGPCDPRDVEMNVTTDAEALRVRPAPFQVYDVYAVVDRFIDHDALTHATGEYLYTEGARPQVDAYRKKLVQLGTGRAFLVKRKREMRAH